MSVCPTFHSALGPTIAAYVGLKQALGWEFRKETAILAHLDGFLVAQRAQTLTATGFAAWALTFAHLTPRVRRERMRIVRNLCLYHQRTERHCFVPDTRGFPAPSAPRQPFIFSPEQIAALLRAAATLGSTVASPLRAEVYRLAIVLLYTTGLRRGELVRLAIDDYHPTPRTLLVRASKFHRSRVVPLSPDGAREVDRYLVTRRQLPHAPDSPVLANLRGKHHAYSGVGIARGLRGLFRTAGVRTPTGDLPRVHDLRHTYAVHVLLRWYHAGINVQSQLPALATAMGHVSVVSTAYYLNWLEPVAEAANERFLHHVQPIFDPTGGVDHE
ncbi:MAG: tyrosine-type recombinase/integrase [Spirochaetaceae bacterium]|nr:tyrosine-type recombinase/integrase [Spirochaetaceae bacterium]